MYQSVYLSTTLCSELNVFLVQRYIKANRSDLFFLEPVHEVVCEV